MGDFRIDFSGLIGFVMEDLDPRPDAVTRFTAVFADPWGHGLHPHWPRLVVDDASTVDWLLTSLSPMPNVPKLTFDLSQWDVVALVDGEPTRQPGVATPDGDRSDPDLPDQRILSHVSKLLALDQVCGDNQIKSEFLAHPPTQDVLGRVVVDRGTIHTVSEPNGVFEDWQFTLEDPPFLHQQRIAGILAWKTPATKYVQLHLRGLRDPTLTRTLTFNCPINQVTRVEIRHTCDEPTCGPHKAAHIELFYDMIRSPARRPMAVPPACWMAYCPAGRFRP